MCYDVTKVFTTNCTLNITVLQLGQILTYPTYWPYCQDSPLANIVNMPVVSLTRFLLQYYTSLDSAIVVSPNKNNEEQDCEKGKWTR